MNMQRALPALLLALTWLSGCATVRGGGSSEAEEAAEAAREGPMHSLATTPEEFLANPRGIYVVVDLSVNRLRLMDGRTKVWEAPVGTGTGLRLQGPDGEWHFSTPRGVFQIQFKEEMPLWYLPDWYFVEKKLPIPPQDSPERKLAGQLGVAAVYLGREIAIHGTDKPELLGQRVSHGCIRLANEFVLRLFHNVQVGTPVVIVGGEELDDVPPPPTPTARRTAAAPQRDPYAGVSSDELLARLDRELAREGDNRDWVPIASRLITRGLKDDATALRGVLMRAGTARTAIRNREYATFLADAYTRGGLRAVVSLARIGAEERKKAARAIVQATMALYPGDLADQTAPWPTRRISTAMLGPDGREGWAALARAEDDFRDGRGSVVLLGEEQ